MGRKGCCSPLCRPSHPRMLLRFPCHLIYAVTWQSKTEKGERKHPYPALQGYFISIICHNEVQGLGFLWCCFLPHFLYFVDHPESYFRTLSHLACTFSTSTGGPAACIHFQFSCASFMQNHCSNAPGTLQVQFSHSVVSYSLLPHALHHARPSCPSPTPGACSKLMSIESVMSSNHLLLCCPLLLRPSIFPSIRVFSSESVLCIRWPKYWSFSFSIRSSQ